MNCKITAIVADEITSTSNHIASNSSTLEVMSDQMNELVSKFKIKEL
ncbi:hypothetical protein ACMC5R_11840 [Deferribacteres bacterium DY0037]